MILKSRGGGGNCGNRRVLFCDRMAYKKQEDARLKAMAELAAQAQELDMGY